MIISEIQSEIGHCSCDSAKFKAPADFSHHAILCMPLSLKRMKFAVPRFTGKTRITGKTAEIPERPKNNRETFIGDH